MATIGAAFKPLGSAMRRLAQPAGKPRGVKLAVSKSLNYERIKAEVDAAIAQLPSDQQRQIPLQGTLPERMVALALVQIGWFFRWQSSELGGRLRVGGSVVDMIVYFGGSQVTIRVMGAYWHSIPDRRHKDVVQAERLRAQGYRVFDAGETELYKAWTEGRLREYVRNGVMNAG